MSNTTFGKYQFIAMLGSGGMAEVYLAALRGIGGFNKLLVIKVMRDDVAEDPDFVAMLMDEARLAAQLNHPNVVQTVDVGDIDGQYYIAMEHLDGQPLDRIQKRARGDSSKFPREFSYHVLSEALLGLHHAHELRDFHGNLLEVVHRDVTPHNIFVTYEGQAKMVDFGVAKAHGRSHETKNGVMKGKIRYMAPEQTSNTHVDRRADIFAAGINLWEAAIGTRFWAPELSEIEVLHRLKSGDFNPSPQLRNPEIPDAIDAMCRKAMAHNPDDRYQTAMEFRIELDQYLAETGANQRAKRDLGAKVATMFKDVRTELRQVIDAQLETISREQPVALKTMKTVDEISQPSSPRIPIADEATPILSKAPAEPAPVGSMRIAAAITFVVVLAAAAGSYLLIR